MGQHIRDNDVLDKLLRNSHRENLHSTRAIGSAIWDWSMHWKAAQHPASVGILIEWLVAGNRHQSIFTALLIFGFHGRIKHGIQRSIGINYRFGAAAANG